MCNLKEISEQMAQLEYERDSNFQSNISVRECSECGTQIVNASKSKREVFCENCQCHKKYGISLFEYKRLKQREQMEKSKQRHAEKLKTPQKPKKAINKVSDKQKEINAKLKEVKDKVTEDAINQNQYFCKGCGIVGLNLDRSHRLSVKHRPDLQFNYDNLVLLCRGCHSVFEGGDISKIIQMNCFIEDMEYIFNNDTKRFNQLFFKLLDYYEKTPEKWIKRIIKKIEQFNENGFTTQEAVTSMKLQAYSE